MRSAEEVRYLILAAQREGNRRLTQALKPLGITPSQAEVIRLLRDFQPLTINELGGLLVCESGTNPSRLVDRLVLGGLVERRVDSRDRRVMKLTLTTKGRQVADQVLEIEDALYAMIEQKTTALDRKSLIKSLQLLLQDEPLGAAIERRKQTGSFSQQEK